MNIQEITGHTQNEVRVDNLQLKVHERRKRQKKIPKYLYFTNFQQVTVI